ncbi:MAG: ATP-binding protein, partial [Cyanobacteria bacterium P01_E01_bin.43]
ESNRLQLTPHFFDLKVLIQEVLSEMHWMVSQKELAIQALTNLEDGIVYNDRQRLKQILINLLSNAIKFTEQGTIDIEVNSLAKNSLEICVRDTGIGIADEQLSTIFQPFRQVDQSIIRKHAGTGLGLAITHSLVSMMQGWITVSSQIGQGSTFRIQIPRQISEPTTP